MPFDKEAYLGRAGLSHDPKRRGFQSGLESIVDFELNYGRAIVVEFATRCAPYSRVLDIGAGPGADLLTARAVQPCASLSAIECYRPFAERLMANGVTVHSLDLEKDPFPYREGTFDLIIANQVLEHVKQLFWILHNVTQSLATGGHFIIGVPNIASLHNRILLALGYQPTQINSFSAHVRGFTKHDLLRLINSCWPHGYSLEAHRGSNFYPFPPFIANPLSRLLPSMAWGTFLLLRKVHDYDGEFLSVPASRNFETNFFFG